MKLLDITETAIIEVEVKDNAGNYVDPITSITITITDPDGTEVVSGAAMSKSAVGQYYYDYTIPSGAVKGCYLVKVTVTDGARVTIEQEVFKVK